MPGSAADGPLAATSFDIDILREMYPRGGVEISGIDPRLNANRIASRLRVSRARVSARLRRWREAGFLDRYDVWPNPHLFGLTGVSLDVRAHDRTEKPEVIERLGLVPGAIGGLDVVGDWLAATFVLPIGDDPARVGSLVRNLAGVADVANVQTWGAPPEAARALSGLERRIVDALRQFPTESLTAIARHVGVSTRTITARYGRLLDDRAVWFLPAFDFRALAGPILSLYVEFADPTERPSFGRALRQQYPASMEFVRAPFGPLMPEHVGSYFVAPGSAADVDALERWAKRAPRVRGVEASTLVRVLSFPETFGRLLRTEASVAARTGGAARAGRPPRASHSGPSPRIK